MKNQLFCLVFLFLIIFTTIGQQREYQVADSLLTDYLSDTSAQRVIKLEGVMNYSSLLPPELMIRYAKKVDSILDLKSDSLLEYAVNGMFSGAYMKLMVLDSMLKYSKRKLAVAEKYAAFNDPNQNDWKARSLADISWIGKTYEHKGDLPVALEYYQRCVKVAEEIGYRAYLHYFLLDIATINEEMNNYETTAEYLNLAWDVATENKDSMFLINVQNARAVMYHDMKAYDKALENYYKVLKDCYKYQLYDRIILSQVNIGGVYRDQENWDSALVHYESALNLMDRLNTNVTSKTINSNIGDTIRLFIEIGDLYTQTGDYTQAKRFLDRAGTGIHKIQTVDLKFLYYRAMYTVSRDQGYYRKATVYNDSAWILRDSVLSIEKQKAVAEIQTRYETEKKEQQILILEAKNQVNELQLQRNRLILFGTVLLTLIILITVILLFRQNRLQNQQKMLALEQKLLRAQMNPHFIFNSLASIQNFIVSQDPVKASIYLSRFSDLVRSILINSAEEFVPLEKEIKTIENYLELQKIRFPDKFTYSLEVDETIDTESIKIPPMLAQPFIENSIEHGIRHKKETGHINIRFTLQDGAILFEVKDNGVGRARAQEIEIASRSGHRSMATSITTDRLKALNKKLRKKIRLNIIDLESSVGEPTGTKVVFDIPYRLA